MKRLLCLVALGSCLQMALFAQNYHNEWIDYSQTYYKIKTASKQLHRVSYDMLTEVGIPLTGADFKMIFQGEEVPLYVSTEGEFATGDYIEFYGRQNDGQFDSLLFQKPEWQLHRYQSLFTDTAVFYLTSDNGEAHLRYADTPNIIGIPSVAESHFWHTAEHPFLNVLFAGVPFRDELMPYNNHFPHFGDAEGFTSSAINAGDTKSFNIATPSVYDNGEMAAVSVKTIGNSDDINFVTDHHGRILHEGTAYADFTSEGYGQQILDFELPVSELSSATTTFEVEALGDLSDTDRQGLSYINIRYPHSFDFDGQKNYLFKIDNDELKYLEVTNFEGGSQPILYDLTHDLRMLPQIDNSGGETVYQFLLEAVTMPGATATRQLFLSSTEEEAIVEAEVIETVQFTDFNQPNQQGNYLIITHPKLAEGAIDQTLRYQNYRNTPEGGSYEAVTINIEELYDQFAYGNVKHPLAIQHFVNYALDNWSIAPEYLLLLGKAIGYHKFRLYPPDLADCLVPTYGHRSSDMLLSARDVNSSFPQLATGRVPASTPDHVRIYLDKVIDYEDDRNLPCTREDRLWTKDAVHFVGGNDFEEDVVLLNYLNGYQSVFENAEFGGNVVTTFSRNQSVPINDDFVGLDELMDNGLKVINFIGHSGLLGCFPEYETEDFQNAGQYPFIFTNSSFVGNIHAPLSDPTEAMPIRYLFAEERGAIGFFGTPSFALLFDKGDTYFDEIYQSFCQTHYDRPIGYNIQQSIAAIAAAHPTDTTLAISLQEFTLAGDPAIVLGFWDVPELIIEQNVVRNDVTFDPPYITTNLDSFALHLVVSNLGKATNELFNIRIDRNLPDGSLQTVTKRVTLPLRTDTFTVYIPNGNPAFAGENQFVITLDADNELEEDCTDNNVLTLHQNIFADVLIPVSPCNFGIVSDPDLTLMATTGLPFSLSQNYIIEIDTTALFDSPLLQATTVTSTGGVLKWQPSLSWENETVYYWRTTLENSTSFNDAWQNSSFVFKNEGMGWNQSHYYQFLNNDLQQIGIDSLTRTFEFEGSSVQIFAHNALLYYQIYFGMNNIQLGDNSCLSGSACRGGVSFVVFKPEEDRLEPLVSEPQFNSTLQCDKRGTFGNLHCSDNDVMGIEFHTGTVEQIEAMLAFLENNIEPGDYVLAYGIFNHRLGNPQPGDPMFDYIDEVRGFFTDHLNLSDMASVTDERPFIAFSRKDAADFEPTLLTTNDPLVQLTFETIVQAASDIGRMETPLIGPARSWERIVVDMTANSSDEWSFDVFGRTAVGEEALLFENISDPLLDISSINAADYPYLQLKAVFKDTITQTAPDLNAWQVFFDPIPDLAVDAGAHLVLTPDTLQEGELIHLELGITNAGMTASDSVVLQMTIIDQNNVSHLTPLATYAPIAAGQTVVLEWDYSTTGYVGNNRLEVVLQPNEQQLDKLGFNNYLLVPFDFVVIGDPNAPTIDVTFDGEHILDGELVSAKPEIAVHITDENLFLALNDTANVELILCYPNGTQQPITFGSETLTFVPASENDAANGMNEMQILLSPEFSEDGIHSLKVNATDRSGNAAEGGTYQVSFLIVTESLVSNVVNYPNPFSTSTRFVFTLTGSEIPESFQIQIMTVSGRVVREISKAELGNLKLGQNITEFAWDGKDAYGNELANGLYLYRVKARVNGEILGTYSAGNGVDDLFKNGVGKMYLLR